ncbi:MAG: hypothetical protein K6E40_13660, partial [Desulfovibrio sp.]|nr:hypothetical protein [Desulfovibrio sp.]
MTMATGGWKARMRTPAGRPASLGTLSRSGVVAALAAGAGTLEGSADGKIDTSAYQSIASQVLSAYPNVKTIAITLRESFSA